MNKLHSAVCVFGLAALVAVPTFAEPQATPRDSSLGYEIDVQAYVAPVTVKNKLPHYSRELQYLGIQGDVVLTEAEMRRMEKKNLRRALQQARWKIYGSGGAAELLGIKPTTLVSRIRKLGLKR